MPATGVTAHASSEILPVTQTGSTEDSMNRAGSSEDVQPAVPFFILRKWISSENSKLGSALGAAAPFQMSSHRPLRVEVMRDRRGVDAGTSALSPGWPSMENEQLNAVHARGID